MDEMQRVVDALFGSVKVVVVDTLPSDAWMLVSQRDDGTIEVACDKGHAIIPALAAHRAKG